LLETINVEKLEKHSIDVHNSRRPLDRLKVKVKVNVDLYSAVVRTSPLKVGFHYPSSRPEFTGRELGP